MQHELPRDFFSRKELIELRLIDALQLPVGQTDMADGTLLAIGDRYCTVINLREGTVVSAELTIPGLSSQECEAITGYRFNAPPDQGAMRGSWSVSEIQGDEILADAELTDQLVDLLESCLRASSVIDLEADAQSRKLMRRLERKQRLEQVRNKYAPSAFSPAIAYFEAWQRVRRHQIMLGLVAVHARLHTPVERTDTLR